MPDMPSEYFIWIIIVPLYLPICLFVFWRLFPRLSNLAKRLAFVMLAAQLLVIALSPTIADGWSVWNLDYEGTIPAAIASTQLALVSVVVLATAWLKRTHPKWSRMYLIGMGLIFLLFAIDESFNPIRPNLENKSLFLLAVAAVGALLAGATVIVAARSPRQALQWHICLLAGLAISAAGALVVEQFRLPRECAPLGIFWHNDHCRTFVLEETMEFLGVWLVLIAALGQLSNLAPRPPYALRWLLYLFPFVWIVVIPAPSEMRFLVAPGVGLVLVAAADMFSGAAPRIRRFLRLLIALAVLLWLLITYLPEHISFFEYHFLTAPAAVTYESGLQLRIYRIDYHDTSVSVQFFAALGSRKQYRGDGYSLHLVDQVEGSSVAGIDDSARRQTLLPLVHLTYRSHIYKKEMEVDIPQDARTNRALWLVLTAWQDKGDSYVRQRVISSDHRLLGDSQVILAELVFPAESAAATREPFAAFENGMQLEAAELSQTAQIGNTLFISFVWHTQKADLDDYTQFVHFEHRESGEWWGYDRQPLGARLPTRLWYSGLRDNEIWAIPLPDHLAPGIYSVYTGLYDSRDLKRLPVRAADGRFFPNDRVTLGSLTLAKS